MSLDIQGINSGAGISRFSEAMINVYGLNKAGYAFPKKAVLAHLHAPSLTMSG